MWKESLVYIVENILQANLVGTYREGVDDNILQENDLDNEQPTI
jgi:hypothetical protein